jgi:phosphatidylglycerophosphate synthase
MEDKDLKKLWAKADDKAEDYYDRWAPEVENKARKASHDILEKVRRNIYLEIFISLPIVIGFPFIFLHNLLLFVLSWVIMLAVLIVSLRVYRRYLRGIKEVPELDLREGLRKKHEILVSYVRRIKVLSYISAFVGLLYGVFIQFAEDNYNTDTWGDPGFLMPLGATLIIFMVLFIWGINKYIFWMYGKAAKRIGAVLSGLEAPEKTSG